MTHVDDTVLVHHTESAAMPKKTKSATKSAGKKRGKSKSAGSKKKGGKKSGKRSAKLSAKSSASKIDKEPVDMLHPAVMENLYYIAHDAPDALSMRGFGWPDAPKKKGKGKKGKKKKK